MSVFSTIASAIKRPLILVPALIIVGGLSWYFTTGRGGGNETEPVRVTRGTIIQEVTVTGKTKAIASVDLAFERGGRIARVNYGISASVGAGEAIAVLDQSELAAETLQAEADVAAKDAALAEAKRGTRLEEINISQVKADNARAARSDAVTNLRDRIADAYTKSDDAVRVKGDQFFSNPRSANPELTFVTDGTTEHALETGRLAIEKTLTDWSALIMDIPEPAIPDVSRKSRTNLNTVKAFLNTAALALTSLTANTQVSQTTLDGWRSDISTARTNVNTALSNLTAADEKLRTAESNLAVAENELALARAGSTPETIAAKEAELERARATVLLNRAQLERTVLRAPFAGLITRQDAKAGEIVGANITLVSLISKEGLEIEANVPEVDIGKVQVGNPATIALDALAGEKFTGKVIVVEPGETIVDGVVNYKVRIILNERDARLKSGLTADLRIETLRKPGVLVLPQYAVRETADGAFVRKRENNTVVERTVVLGARGQDGNVEIVSGIAEGDVIESNGATNEK